MNLAVRILSSAPHFPPVAAIFTGGRVETACPSVARPAYIPKPERKTLGPEWFDAGSPRPSHRPSSRTSFGSHMYGRMYVCMYVCMDGWTDVCMCACVYMYACVCACAACMYASTYICIYIYIYLSLSLSFWRVGRFEGQRLSIKSGAFLDILLIKIIHVIFDET